MTEADKADEARMENWKGDMDAILIFVRLMTLRFEFPVLIHKPTT